MPISIPADFDGAKFAEKFNTDDFWIEGGQLVCPGLPDLTEADIADCVVDMVRWARVKARRTAAIITAKAIPDWAAWDQAQWAAWRDANISAAKINAIGNLADAKAMLIKMSIVLDRLAKMEIAIRDQVWPDLPENGAPLK